MSSPATCMSDGCRNIPVVAWHNEGKVLCHDCCETILDSQMETIDMADDQLGGWRRQIDSGHPIRREQVNELRERIQVALENR